MGSLGFNSSVKAKLITVIPAQFSRSSSTATTTSSAISSTKTSHLSSQTPRFRVKAAPPVFLLSGTYLFLLSLLLLPIKIAKYFGFKIATHLLISYSIGSVALQKTTTIQFWRFLRRTRTKWQRHLKSVGMDQV